MDSVKILGTGRCLPARIVTNDDFCEFIDTSDEWVRTRTGIRTRHLSDGEPNWYLGSEAAKQAIEQAGIGVEEIDLIICSTVTPDYFTPATANIVQGILGAHNAFSFDISSACSGFVYALDMARRYLLTGEVKTALIVSSEVLSNITNFEDRSSCVLFGDGAGAAVVRVDKGIYASVLGTDATGLASLYAKCPVSHSRFNHSQMQPPCGMASEDVGYLHMDGKEVYKFATKTMPLAVEEACKRAGISVHELDWVFPHQANIRIVQTAMKNLGLPMEKAFINLDAYGNTSSATIPMALDEASRAGKLKRSDKLVVVGFGAGLTYGAAVFEW